MIAVDTYHWWGPLGWIMRNTPGNIAASVIWAGPPFLAGTVYGKHRVAKVDAHAKWTAQTLAKVHLAAVGEHADPHPEHGALTSD